MQGIADDLQLPAYLVPLDRNRGAFDRDHGVVGHHWSPGVGRGQLDGPGSHQRRREDRGHRVGGHFVAVVVPERDLDLFGLRLDRLDAADLHPEDTDVVSDIDAVAVLEVGHDVDPVDPVGGAHQQRNTGNQQHDQRDANPGSEIPHGVPSPGTSGGAWPGAGIEIGFGVGDGVDARPGGAGAGGPGGGPPGGGAGSGSR